MTTPKNMHMHIRSSSSSSPNNNSNNKEATDERHALTHALTQQTARTDSGTLFDTERTSMPDIEEDILPALTLDEKLRLVSGDSVWLLADLPRWNLSKIRLSDGPHGVRKPVRDLSLHDALPATCFPTAAALACSWDEALLYQVGTALARECEHYKVAVLLGPGMNLKRHPAGGRNFEYLAEDPYLTGRLATAYVRGVQASGKVAACPKHFAVNNQEDHRFVVTAVVDERTSRELYLRAFHTVVREAAPETLMCAYNQVNGTYCSEHVYLNRTILRDEWGFTGVLMTDWGATNDRAAALASTIDLEMPGSHGAQNRILRRALADPTHDLTVENLDASAQRVLRLIVRHQPPPSPPAGSSSSMPGVVAVDWPAQHALAKAAALQCAVLLQNKDNLLPLAHHTKIALIGDFGRDHPRYQGMGSSQVTTECVLTAYEEVFRYTQALFATGYHYDDEHPEEVDTSLLQEAVAVAQQAEVVLLFVGLPEIMESEAFDRPHLGLPAQHNALVTEICKIHGKVVVVLSNGGPVELPWADLPQAILEGYLLGEAGAAAVVDLVFGQVSPSGRLAETFPLRQRDVLADRYFPGTQERVEYREGLNVGYRYFDTAKVPVRFPFGHGLTYTTFEYADLQILSIDVSKTEVKLSLALSNTGLVEASEVVQCYIHPMNSQVYRPEHELKAYSKIFARPGCSVRVAFSLSREAFSFYDVGVGDWVVENGAYEIRIGASSRDIRLHSLITLETGETASELAISTHPPLSQETAAHLTDHVKDEDFYRRFRTAFDSGPGVDPRSTGIRSITPFHQSTLLKDLARRRLLGRLLLWIAYKGASADVKPGTSHDRQKRLARVAVENIPLRTLVLFSRGGMSYELLDAFLALMNRQWCGALWKFRVAFTPFRK